MKLNNALWKKITACGLVAVLSIGTLAGCGGGKDQSASGKVKLSFGMVEEPNITQAGYANIAETPFGKAWQEATGVELEVVQYASADALNLAIAGGDLPDVVFFTNNTDVSNYLNDGVAIPLNDYMEEYAPDYMALLNSDRDVLRRYSNIDGDIGGFGFVRGDAYLQTYLGLIVREDWLKDLNLEVPSTPAEFKDMLVAFRDKKGAKSPLSSETWQLFVFNGMITSGFGLPSGGWYQEDGKAHLGWAEPEFEDVLVYMRELYSEGLFDKNFMTMNRNDNSAALMNGEAGVCLHSVGGGVGTIMTTMADDPSFSVTGIAPLVEKKGDIAALSQFDPKATDAMAVITKSCKNVEAAVKFLNYGYTEEGSMLMNFGIEGQSYNMVDGYPTYTEEIMNNPKGLSKAIAMSSYMRSQMSFPFVQRKEYMEQYSSLPQQKAALDAFTKHNGAKYTLGHIAPLTEDAEEYTKLFNDILSYVSEYTQKYIIGEVAAENYETDFVKKIEKMNVKRLIEIMQTALDSYNAR